MTGTFLPDRLRPHAQRRASRRPLVAVVVIPLVLAVVPMWRVQAVDVSGCASVPEVVTASIEGLVGRPVLTVSPQWVRRQLEVWPEVAAVEVRLELPNTLRVSARRTEPHGSVAIGRGWHAVTHSGSVGGRLGHPVLPALDGFPCRPHELRRALSVARRIEASTGAVVESVRIVTPTDYEVRVRSTKHDRVTVLHVGPQETDGERHWAARLAAGEDSVGWVDLRWDDRVVMGGAG